MATQMLYEKVLDELGEDWRHDPSDEGYAAQAILATVLETGRADANTLKHLTEWDHRTLLVARTRLRDHGPLEGGWTDCKIACSEGELNDGLWWALMGAVGHGYIESVAA